MLKYNNKKKIFEIPLNIDLSKEKDFTKYPYWLQGLIIGGELKITKDLTLSLSTSEYLKNKYTRIIIHYIIFKLSNIDLNTKFNKNIIENTILKKFDNRTYTYKSFISFKTKKNSINNAIYILYKNKELPFDENINIDYLNHWILSSASPGTYTKNGNPTSLFLKSPNANLAKNFLKLSKILIKNFNIKINIRKFNKKINTIAINKSNNGFYILCNLLEPKSTLTLNKEINYKALEKNIFFSKLFYKKEPYTYKKEKLIKDLKFILKNLKIKDQENSLQFCLNFIRLYY